MKRLTIVVLVTMVCSVSQAAVIAEYTFGSNLAATTTGANVTAGAFVVGPGLAGGADRSTTGGGCMYARSTYTYGTALSIGDALAVEDYLTATIGADSGYELNLTSLTLDFGYTSNGVTALPKSLKVYLLTDVDGFVDSGDIVGSKQISATITTNTPQYTAVTIDLSDARFQGLAGAREFRLYFSDTANLNDLIHRIDNVVLNGSVTVSAPPDAVPVVDAGLSYVTWLGNGTLPLAGAVDDRGDGDVSNADVVWSIMASPPGSNPALTKTSTEWANPTADFTPDLSIDGDYTIELTATDAAAQAGSDTLVVQVAVDACGAAQLVDAISVYDDNGNCTIDLPDLAAFAAKWLSDKSLTGPVAY